MEPKYIGFDIDTRQRPGTLSAGVRPELGGGIHPSPHETSKMLVQSCATHGRLPRCHVCRGRPPCLP